MIKKLIFDKYFLRKTFVVAPFYIIRITGKTFKIA